MPRLLHSRLAHRDLEELWDHIAEENPSAADRFLDRIQQSCTQLAAQPEMGQRRPEFASGQYRSFSIGAYVVYYRPLPDGIVIARVLHGARDHGRLL